MYSWSTFHSVNFIELKKKTHTRKTLLPMPDSDQICIATQSVGGDTQQEQQWNNTQHKMACPD